jgi:hypothetical protein
MIERRLRAEASQQRIVVQVIVQTGSVLRDGGATG